MRGGVDGGLPLPTFPCGRFGRVLRGPPVPDRIEDSAELFLHTSDEFVGRLAGQQVQVDLGQAVPVHGPASHRINQGVQPGRGSPPRSGAPSPPMARPALPPRHLAHVLIDARIPFIVPGLTPPPVLARSLGRLRLRDRVRVRAAWLAGSWFGPRRGTRWRRRVLRGTVPVGRRASSLLSSLLRGVLRSRRDRDGGPGGRLSGLRRCRGIPRRGVGGSGPRRGVRLRRLRGLGRRRSGVLVTWGRGSGRAGGRASGAALSLSRRLVLGFELRHWARVGAGW